MMVIFKSLSSAPFDSGFENHRLAHDLLKLEVKAETILELLRANDQMYNGIVSDDNRRGNATPGENHKLTETGQVGIISDGIIIVSYKK